MTMGDAPTVATDGRDPLPSPDKARFHGDPRTPARDLVIILYTPLPYALLAALLAGHKVVMLPTIPDCIYDR